MRNTCTNTKYERGSDSKCSPNSYTSTRQVKVMKRLLMLLMITICLVFGGAQSMPSTQAQSGCELVCGNPFIDPNDGQCYVMCCPASEKCKRMCELRPVKGCGN